MSEQDNKKSCGSGGSVVMVDKPASSRHKPYRPTELQQEPVPDLKKRSKAPAVPSVPEDLKNITVSEPPEPLERMEIEHNEKHMHESKNISSSGKRRDPVEEIAMVSLEEKKDNLLPLSQPIPAQVEVVVSEASGIEATVKSDLEKRADSENRADDDSITEEITELRTVDAAVKEHSEWPSNSAISKKKEISWQDDQYVYKVHLQKTVDGMCQRMGVEGSAGPSPSPQGWTVIEGFILGTSPFSGRSRSPLAQGPESPTLHLSLPAKVKEVKAKSQAALLERKASVGPCFRSSVIHGGPSGISICVPKKSVRVMKEEFNPIPSVINFNHSKRMQSKSTPAIVHKPKKVPRKQEVGIKIAPEEKQQNFFNILRMKLDTMTCKIRNLLNT